MTKSAVVSAAYWWVTGVGAVLTMARFSEAFLVLRAAQGGLPLAFTPLVLVVMNVAYALSAYPAGHLSDRLKPRRLLALGLLLLIGADVVLAHRAQGPWLWMGLALWGLHMGVTQGLLAKMIADTAPQELRGTAFGLFNLVSGLAMLAASTLAGFLWGQLGAPATFLAGAIFAALTMLGLLVPAPRTRV